jgi:thiazole synthase
MTLERSLSVKINGEQHRVDGGISIAEMVRELGFDPKRVAVERNLEVVPRSSLDQVSVAEGDAYEIVRFVGGG